MSSNRKKKSSSTTSNNASKSNKSFKTSSSKVLDENREDDDDFYISKSKKSPPESLKSEPEDGDKSPFPMTSSKSNSSVPEESDQESDSWKADKDKDSADDSENKSHNSEDFPENKVKSLKSKSNDYDDLEKSMSSMKSARKSSDGGNSFNDDIDDDCDEENEEKGGQKRKKSRKKSYGSLENESNDGSRDDKENAHKSASEILQKRKVLKEKRQQYQNQKDTNSSMKKDNESTTGQGQGQEGQEGEENLSKKVVTSLFRKAWSICLERYEHKTASIRISLDLRDAWLRIAEVEWMDTKSKLTQNTREIFESDEPPYPLAFDTWARGALEILPRDRRESIMDPFMHHTDDGRGDGKKDDLNSTDEEKEKDAATDGEGVIGKMQTSRAHSRKGRSSTRSSSRHPSSQGSITSQVTKSSRFSSKTTSSRTTQQQEPESEPHHRKLITEKEKFKTRQTFVKPKFVESDFGLGEDEGGDTRTINSKKFETSTMKSQLPSKSSQIVLTAAAAEEEAKNQSVTTTTSNKPYYTKEEQELLNSLEEKTSQFPFALEKLPPMIPSDKQEPLFDRKPSFFNTILPAKLIGPPSPHVSEHYVKLGLSPWNPADYPGHTKSGVFKAFGQLSAEALAEHRERFGINQEDIEKAQAENNENRLDHGDDRNAVEMADEDTGDEGDNELDDEQLNWEQNTGKILLRKKSSTETVASINTTATTIGNETNETSKWFVKVVPK